MEFTEQQIAHFRELYRKHFGRWLTQEEAEDKGHRLVNFIRATNQFRLNHEQENEP